MDESGLRHRLQELRNEGFRKPDDSEARLLIDGMLAQLGSPDGELRDGLIYKTFNAWISSGRLDAELLRILHSCLDEDFLEFRIESREEESVFKRSFSLLVIALVLERDKEARLLGRAKLREVFAALCRAYGKETCLVGYVEGKGWAHSVAHAADAFDVLAASGQLGRSDYAALLDLIRQKFSQGLYYFIDGEDERTARVIGTMLARQEDSAAILLDWVPSLASYERSGSFPQDSILQGNIRNLLRSIYFCADIPAALGLQIRETLKSLGYS